MIYNKLDRRLIDPLIDFALKLQTIGPDGKELTEWEKFALDQYRVLVTEDDNENDGDEIYEDDFEVRSSRSKE